jgi:hypothetical protein
MSSTFNISPSGHDINLGTGYCQSHSTIQGIRLPLGIRSQNIGAVRKLTELLTQSHRIFDTGNTENEWVIVISTPATYASRHGRGRSKKARVSQGWTTEEALESWSQRDIKAQFILKGLWAEVRIDEGHAIKNPATGILRFNIDYIKKFLLPKHVSADVKGQYLRRIFISGLIKRGYISVNPSFRDGTIIAKDIPNKFR